MYRDVDQSGVLSTVARTYASPGWTPPRHEITMPADGNDPKAEPLTLGQRAADAVTSVIGSWRFILAQAVVLLIWLVANSIAWFLNWDPYPFILLNLVLSFQAAFAAPIIMMSQNRQAARDRQVAAQDYDIDLQAIRPCSQFMLAWTS